jgi:aryl-alcohol dehydrogenase-like predicted oxidoreductase
MRMKPFGNTGLIVSEVCLGAMTFGDTEGMWSQIAGLGQAKADELVKAAIEGGVNFFDTANVYSGGRSEEILGQSLRNLGIARDQFVLATKVLGRAGPGVNQLGLSRYHIMAALDASLKRLQMDHVDLYQIHGTDPVTPIEETLEALTDCVRAGKVRYLGVSNHAAWHIAKSLGISARRGLARFESIQAYYSLAGRELEREIVPLAHDQKLAILPWSPLAGGFLSGKFSRDAQGPAGARRTTFDFPPVDRDKGFRIIDVMRPIAERHGVSVARVALAWLLHQGAVTSVIIGARNRDQLLDNLAATQVRLGAEDLGALDEVSALAREYPGWMIERMATDRLGTLRQGR